MPNRPAGRFADISGPHVDRVLGTWDELLGALPAPLVCLIVGVTVVAESGLLWGIVLPGASGLLALGFLARLGVVGLPWAMATGMCAALVGSTVGYLLGRRSGLHGRAVRLAERITGRDLAHAGAVPERWGGPAVSGAQWVAVSRTLVPRLAASAGWPYRRFAVWNVPSAALWGSGQVFFGWLAGQAYREVARWSTWVGGTLLVVVTVIVLSAAIRSAHRASPVRRG